MERNTKGEMYSDIEDFLPSQIELNADEIV